MKTFVGIGLGRFGSAVALELSAVSYTHLFRWKSWARS